MANEVKNSRRQRVAIDRLREIAPRVIEAFGLDVTFDVPQEANTGESTALVLEKLADILEQGVNSRSSSPAVANDVIETPVGSDASETTFGRKPRNSSTLE